jgi:two-component system cell cycle sensor histidine kinase PleC
LDFLRFFRLDRASDVRVVKSQLDLTAMSVHAIRYTPPLWSVAIALLCSKATHLFGHHGLRTALYLPVIVIAGVVLSAGIAAIYLRRTAGVVSLREIGPWHTRFLAAQMAVGISWGVMPWLLWESGNSANHLFLACCCIAVTSGVITPRGCDGAMFAASQAPISLLTAARFLSGDNSLDYVIAFAVPLFALQMGFARRPLVARMQKDARLRFQVEDLARELEETRDDALKKRFEAEAANASKTAFLANMSHELRTPLNAILGFSEIIAEECFGPVGNERYRDYAGDIHASGAHLLSLINDLLDIAKIEAGRMEISPHPLEAGRTFEIALKLIGCKAGEKRQSLTIHVDPHAPPLHADERALKQILINLVSNAVKFTPEGGRIEVEASAARDGGFRILVRDNGPGIPRDKLDKIFAPFSQVDNRYDRQAGGTGLGLALVRGLAELHGGRAWLESEFGHGTTAYVVLPVKAPEQAASAA